HPLPPASPLLPYTTLFRPVTECHCARTAELAPQSSAHGRRVACQRRYQTAYFLVDPSSGYGRRTVISHLHVVARTRAHAIADRPAQHIHSSGVCRRGRVVQRRVTECHCARTAELAPHPSAHGRRVARQRRYQTA